MERSTRGITMTRASDTAKLLGAGATILDGTTISTADNTSQLTLTSTDADASVGPALDLYRNSSSPADSDIMGIVNYKAENSAGETITYVDIIGVLGDVTDGTEDGQLRIQTMTAGSNVNRISVNTTETVINDTSKDLDFRVEGNGDANALFVEGETDSVGVGTNNPASKMTVFTGVNSSTRTFLVDNAHSGGSMYNAFGVYVGATDRLVTLSADYGDSKMAFQTAGSERIRIDNGGNTMFGCTAFGEDGLSVGIRYSNSNTTTQLRWNRANNSDAGGALVFMNAGTQVGTVTYTSSSTSYTTSSDYRLKENVVTDWDATTRLKQLKPSRFNFIADGTDKVVDGFLAHEVSSIVPEAITGTKDEVDDDGNAVIQGIDQSKLVPLLVKTIQELEARITTLENA